MDSANEVMPTDAPTRFEAGSYNILSIAGLHAALMWHNKIGIENVRKTEQDNYAKLLDILSGIDGVTIVGNPQNAVSIASVTFKGLPPDAVERVLSQSGVIARSGLHCAPLAHKFLGTYPEGTVRFSVSYFTSQEDFVKLQEILEEVSHGL